MKIVFVMHGFQPGQKQMQFLNYARYLPRSTEILMLFIRPIDEASTVCADFRALGVQVRSLGCRVDFSPRSVSRVLTALREFGPDIIHSQHAVGGVNAKIAGALYRRRHPHVRIICEQRNARKGLSRFGRILDVATFRLADLVLNSSTGVEHSFFGSSQVLDSAELDGGTFDPLARRHYTFHNSIDVSLFRGASDSSDAAAVAHDRMLVRRELDVPDDAFMFIIAARFSPQKAYDVIAAAAAELQADVVRFCVVCVGDGPLLPEITSLSERLGITERMRFTGYRDDVDRLFRAADCFLLPSRWEGLPKVLLEAMSVGLPVIASDVEGNRDVLADRDCGILIPADDPHALAGAMRELINSPDRVRQLSAAAVRRVADFSVEQKTAELQRIYRQLRCRPELDAPARGYLLRTAEAALSAQRDDGTMPAAHNGAWGQAETAVRTTAHWAVSWLAAYRCTSDQRFRTAAERALDALQLPGWRPHGAAWHCLGDGSGHNDGNGLIGQAWVMEAFLHAHAVLGRTDLLRAALELYRLHRQDSRTGVYFVLGVDGTHHLPDATFNHQAWFAAISAMVLRAARDAGLPLDDLATGPERFADRLFSIMHRNCRYVVEQKVRHRYHGSLHGYLRQAASNLYNRFVTRRLKTRSVGYLTFTLHGVAMLRAALPHHPVWRSARFARLAQHAQRYMQRPEFFSACTANRFAFPHNVTGVEMAYVARWFGIKLPVRRFWDHQFATHWDPDTATLSRHADDPVALAARLYEVVSLLSIDLPFTGPDGCRLRESSSA